MPIQIRIRRWMAEDRNYVDRYTNLSADPDLDDLLLRDRATAWRR